MQPEKLSMSDQRSSTAREKVVALPELARVSQRAREEGKSVVLCHGTFDLLHMGHVRHIETARAFGDILIVTVTADAFVNKGPGRPVFSEVLRAEFLASLQYVDWVAVNPAASAEDAIEEIRPDVYVKGNDYAAEADDVTGKIVTEREAVERHGGRIAFTDEISFSSSSLINAHMSPHAPSAREFLTGLRSNGGRDAVFEAVERLATKRIVFVGEAIVDEYDYVEPMGKTPKENLIATQYRDREIFAGGVIASANHLADFAGELEVIALLGARDSYEDLIRKSLHPKVSFTPIYREDGPTTRKVRFVAASRVQKLFEVYYMDDTPISGRTRHDLHAALNALAPSADVVVVNDFGHGMLNDDTVDKLCGLAPFLAVNTQTNSSNTGFNLITKYPRADFVCIDAPEARLASSAKHGEAAILVEQTLPKLIDCPNFIVTHGDRGCWAYSAGGDTWHVPAFATKIVDTVGAGDAFLSFAAPIVQDSGDMRLAGFLGNVAGALKVEIVGHQRSLDRSIFVKALTGLLK
jgi:rfaE bifunctional protein nucleotidyltransferase chain/domain